VAPNLAASVPIPSEYTLPHTTPLSAVLDVAHKFGGADYREAIEFLVDWSEKNPLLRNQPHAGVQTVWKYEVELPEGRQLFWAVYPHQHKIDMHFTNFGRFSGAAEKKALRDRLEAMPGLRENELPEDRRSVLALSALDGPESRKAFVDVMAWVLEELENNGS